jgi:hypothetical protein
MGRLRIKKPQAPPSRRQQGTGGFPEFWPKAVELNPLAFEEIEKLVQFQNELFRKMWNEQRLQVFRHIAKLCMNSLGAVVVLCLNGYGHDALKLARNIYEGHLTIAYLEKHPDELDDYVEYYHIAKKQQLDALIAIGTDVSSLAHYDREQIEREYERVEARFRKGKHPRPHWCKVGVWGMAEAVEMKDHYKLFYSDVSHLQHVSIWGISNQANDPTGDADTAPSKNRVPVALMAAHLYSVFALEVYNRSANLGFDEAIEQAREGFHRAWGKDGPKHGLS